MVSRILARPRQAAYLRGGKASMTDPLTWSINLGQWGGTRVRVHVLFLLFAIDKLLLSPWTKGHPPSLLPTLGWLSLLLLALAFKMLAQGLMAARLGVTREEVCLWPLGHLGGPGLTVAERSPEAVVVVVAGLATNLALALGTGIGLYMAHVTMVFNPFGNAGTGGAPILAAGGPALPFRAIWWFGWFGYLNWVLFVVNLIPALPLDMGRIFRPIIAARSRDGLIAPWTAHSCALALAIIGLLRWLYFKKPGGGELVGLAILIEILVRQEARMLDEGGFFEDGVFGYDFSQGYTSLEAGAATIRPAREGALTRWRRRRSEVRRRRREAQEAADEQRMDAILEKIHREGRAALSDDEQRFLLRVSVKYKKRVERH